MTPAQRRYVVIETAISVVINTVISIGFVWATFGGMTLVPVRALIVDAAPQSFMIALMSTIVPTLLTRKRLRAGGVAGLPGDIPTALRSLAGRALIGAAIVAVAGVALNAALLAALAPNGLGFSALLAFKAGFGAVLAAVVTPMMLNLALKERR